MKKKIRSLSKLALPTIRKVLPKLISSDLINVQPMSKPYSPIFFMGNGYGLYSGQTYFAREFDGPAKQKWWRTCTIKDIHDPKYKPYFVITSFSGYAIYDENQKPLECTDREIFKNNKLDIENAEIADHEIIFNKTEPSIKRIKKVKSCF